MTSTFQLGQNAIYVDSKGHRKVALIIGTPDSIVEGSRLGTIPEDHYNVLIISASGRQYPRQAVPAAVAVEGNDNYYNSDKNLVGVLYPVGTDIKLNPVTPTPEDEQPEAVVIIVAVEDEQSEGGDQQ